MPQKAELPARPTSLQEAKAAALLPGPPVGPQDCQVVTIVAPTMRVTLHGPNGEVITNRVLVPPGGTIWISVDKPCTWDGVDFYDYVDATYTQAGPVNVPVTINAYPSAGG